MFDKYLNGFKGLTLTKKLFLVFLFLFVFSVTGGMLYGFGTEFPVSSFFVPKFSTIYQVSLVVTFCLGFSLIEDELISWKHKNKRLLFIFFFTLSLLAAYETFLSFNAWFSVYSREGGNIDEVRLVSAESHMNSSGLINISTLEKELNLSIPTKVLFPIATRKASTYNIITKTDTALLFISIYGILMTYRMLNKK